MDTLTNFCRIASALQVLGAAHLVTGVCRALFNLDATSRSGAGPTGQSGSSATLGQAADCARLDSRSCEQRASNRRMIMRLFA